jgi:hypothetical protein
LRGLGARGAEQVIMTDEQKTGYKYNIKFSQSLTSGMIAFHGDIGFDDLKEFDGSVLLTLFKTQEQAFIDAGYKVASTIPNNMKDLAEKKEREKEAREKK